VSNAPKNTKWSVKQRKKSIIKALSRVELLLFPSKCRICEAPLQPGERVICSLCISDFPPPPSSMCPVCGRFYFSPSARNVVCGECRKKAPSFLLHRSAGIYEGRLREAILLYKYGGVEYLARPLAEFASSLEEKIWDVDCIVPVPAHKKRIRERGFDHTRKLAQQLGKIKGIKVRRILERVRYTPPQAGLPRYLRLKNPGGSFTVKRKYPCNRVLLLDDVWTTGSTIKEASSVLKRAGYSVFALTLARDI